VNIRTLEFPFTYDCGTTGRVVALLPSEGEAQPEDVAMLQALYSRNPTPMTDALKLAKASNSGEFMKKYYVGYGHQSIGDMAMLTLSIENVPFPVAALWEHSQMFRGQEASTRYLDFSKQPRVWRTDKDREEQEHALLRYKGVYNYERMGALNHRGLSPAGAHAAACDVARDCLPLGICTSLSWTTSIRDAWAHLQWMATDVEQFRPELRPSCQAVAAALQAACPNSTPSWWAYASRWGWADERGDDFWADPRKRPFAAAYPPPEVLYDNLRVIDLPSIDCVSDNQYFSYMYWISFGAWRELHRHRGVRHNFPYIDWQGGPWVSAGPLAMPLETKVLAGMTGPVDKLHYIVKLRSGNTVHPEVRDWVRDIEQAWRTVTGRFVANDMAPLQNLAHPQAYDRRGTQTIMAAPPAEVQP
jgi:thymidylate synthase ThyX